MFRMEAACARLLDLTSKAADSITLYIMPIAPIDFQTSVEKRA